MITRFFSAVFGTANERKVRALRPLVARINTFEPAISALSDEQLTAQTAKLKERLAAGQSLEESCRKHLLLFVKQQNVQLVNVIMMYS